MYKDVMANKDFADPKALEKTINSLEAWADHKTKEVSLTDGLVTQINDYQVLDDHQAMQLKQWTGKSYRFFSEEAMKEENRACWDQDLEVDDHEGRVVWVVKGWTRP